MPIVPHDVPVATAVIVQTMHAVTRKYCGEMTLSPQYMTIGMVPQVIHAPISRPTQSMIRIAGIALRIDSTIPSSISLQE